MYGFCIEEIEVFSDRQMLIQIYTRFIRPVHEYASEAWDGCSALNEENLKQIQLEISRIKIGLPLFAP